LWLHSLKVAQLLRSAACLHTNQSRSYLNHLVYTLLFCHTTGWPPLNSLLTFEILSIKGFSGRKQQVAGENIIIKSFKIFTPPNIVRISNQKKIIWTGHASRLGDNRNVYKIFYRES